MLHTHRIVGLLKPGFQFVIEILDGPDSYEVSAPVRTIVLLPSHPWGFQPSTERETRNEMILAGREPREANASNTDEPRFLRNDLDVAESTQDVDESQGEVDDRCIGTGKEGLECEASTRMPQIPCDETRTAPWTDPHRVLRAWFLTCLQARRSTNEVSTPSRLSWLRNSARSEACR
jgi:hypothetical protein